MACAFLARAAEHPAAEGVRVLALVWDNASWHVSREVRARLRDHSHNRRADAVGSCCRLPVCRAGARG